MARKLFCDIGPTCYKISEKKEILFRNIKDFFSKEKFAKEKSKEELPNIVKSHASILIRRLHGVDIRLQENKVTNIMIGCTKINGLIVHPGETFSWEAVMGGSTEAQGYLLSKGYSGGKVVQTPGGGVCFVSTTLMQGARAYGLDIIECHDHSLPVSYASRGNEAAVSFGSADLKFANNTGYPVQICMSTDSNTGGCICTISAVK